MNDKWPRRKRATELTTSELKNVATVCLAHITQKFTSGEIKILEIWPHIIGKSFAAATCARKFEEGKLFIMVRNSAAMSMINTPQVKKTIIETYRQKAPEFQIREIIFRIGV